MIAFVSVTDSKRHWTKGSTNKHNGRNDGVRFLVKVHR